MKHTILIIILLFLSHGSSIAQDDSNWRLFPNGDHLGSGNDTTLSKKASLDYSNKDGKVNIEKNKRITSIENGIKEKPYIYGYTIQLVVSQQKSVIKNARYKIMKIKSGIELDDPYESPNIYLYAGRFYDRVSAYKFKHEIASHFPNAIVVGPKKLDLPRIDNISVPTPIIDSTNTEMGH